MSDRTDTAALARIPAAQRAALTRRSTGKGLLHLAGHLALICATGALIASGLPGWWLALLPHGVLLCFLFTLEHEATHQTPFANTNLNEWVGRACGAALCLPFIWFRYFHLAHHRYTNDPEKDPELSAPRPDTWPAFLIYLTGWGYWRGVGQVLWQNAFAAPQGSYLPQSALPRIRSEARWMLALYTLAALSLLASPALIWLWLLPMLIGQPVLRLYLLAEHGRCPQVADMFVNSRTTLTSRLVRFIAWNMPYHAEHHAWPQVPFHQLRNLHREVQEHLQSTAPSYRAFARDYSSALGGAAVRPQAEPRTRL